MMKLYSGSVSWFSRKVEIALHEKQLPFERTMVPFTQDRGYYDKPDVLLRINPKGQVPVLIDGSVALYDSTVIIEYLEEAYPRIQLFPASPADRAAMRQWDVFADEVMLPPIRKLMHRTELHDQTSRRWIELEKAATSARHDTGRLLDRLETALGAREFLCGAFSVADIACFMAVLWNQRLAGPAFASRNALRRWYHRLEERPAFATVTAEIKQADAETSAAVDGAYPD